MKEIKNGRKNLTPGYCRDLKPRDKEYFKEDFDTLIGDILVDILDKELNIDNDRTDST